MVARRTLTPLVLVRTQYRLPDVMVFAHRLKVVKLDAAANPESITGDIVFAVFDVKRMVFFLKSFFTILQLKKQLVRYGGVAQLVEQPAYTRY